MREAEDLRRMISEKNVTLNQYRERTVELERLVMAMAEKIYLMAMQLGRVAERKEMRGKP